MKYVSVPHKIIEDERVGTYEIAVYAVLAKFADWNTGEAFPSVPKIAELCGCGTTKVRQALRTLRDCGHIEIVMRTDKDGRQTSNVYKLTTLHNTLGRPFTMRRDDPSQYVG